MIWTVVFTGDGRVTGLWLRPGAADGRALSQQAAATAATEFADAFWTTADPATLGERIAPDARDVLSAEALGAARRQALEAWGPFTTCGEPTMSTDEGLWQAVFTCRFAHGSAHLTVTVGEDRLIAGVLLQP